MTRPHSSTIVVSYPGSGLNLVRHYVEICCRVRTPGGVPHLITQGPYAFDRAHDVEEPDEACPGHTLFYGADGRPKYSRMLFLLRDYREHCYRRRAAPRVKLLPHFRNLRTFDQFTGEKLLVYYEDLVTTTVSTIVRIIQFLRLSPVTPPSPEGFDMAWDWLIRTKPKHRPYSPRDISFGGERLTDRQRNEAEAAMRSWPAYLGHYLRLSPYDTLNHFSPSITARHVRRSSS